LAPPKFLVKIRHLLKEINIDSIINSLIHVFKILSL